MTSLALRRSAVAVALVPLIAILLLSDLPGRTADASGPLWIAAWGKPFTGGGTPPSNATVRNIARITLGGSAIRIRLTNASGDLPLVVGAATVGLQLNATGPEVVPGTTRRVTFGGSARVTVAPGTNYVYSDPVGFPIQAQQNVAVSLFVPNAVKPPAGTAGWNSSYATAAGTGDRTADETGALFAVPIPNSTYALTAIDVLTSDANGAVVGLGSSTFNGNNSVPESYGDVLSLLSVRVNRLPFGEQKGIVNAGIGGDTLHQAMQDRLERDVFSQTGVTGVIVYDVNDISSGRTAYEIAQDYLSLIKLAHARHIKVFCPTWPPAAQSVAGQGLTGATQLHLLNAWIMNSGSCDGVVDWNAVLRWHAVDPDVYHPDYISDDIHPNQIGHRALADAVPLGWFTKGWPLPPQ